MRAALAGVLLVGLAAGAAAQNFRTGDTPDRIERVCHGNDCERRDNRNVFDLSRVGQRVRAEDCSLAEFRRRHGRAPCPADMAWVCSVNWQVNVCVDRELQRDGLGRPRGSVHRNECVAYCAARGRRLLDNNEWLAACEGTRPESCLRRSIVHPIQARLRSGREWNHDGLDCRNPSNTWRSCMSDLSLNQRRVESGVAIGMPDARERRACVSRYGVRDMVGVLGQWVRETYPTGSGGVRGQFNGGLYAQPRSSCNYTTVAHPADYTDYSIGCRCGRTADQPVRVTERPPPQRPAARAPAVRQATPAMRQPSLPGQLAPPRRN